MKDKIPSKGIKKIDCDGFLTKPVSKKELIGELVRFLPCSYQDDKKSAEARIKEPQETLSPEVLANLPELLGILRDTFTARWKWVSDVFVVDDVEAFSMEIKNLGTRYGVGLLTDWGNKLIGEIQVYDIENASITLEYFPVLVEKIASIYDRFSQYTG